MIITVIKFFPQSELRCILDMLFSGLQQPDRVPANLLANI